MRRRIRLTPHPGGGKRPAPQVRAQPAPVLPDNAARAARLRAPPIRKPGAMSDDFILETRGLTKDFDGFIAVNGVDLKVRRGQIHALIGPNGAGKTTFFNLLTKFLIPSRGQILYRGEDITVATPAEIARRGIVRSFQVSAVFPHLSVLENVRIALQRTLGTSFHFWKREASLSVLDQRALELLESVDLAAFAGRVAVELPYGRKRALEIATTLAAEPALLLLDEPMQGMGHEDVERVAGLVKAAARDRTVLMVEHNMNVVATIADTITVLQRGQVIASGGYAEIAGNPLVIEAYLGAPGNGAGAVAS
jgi:branched-chain amino acid transport system ATP-binding protein